MTGLLRADLIRLRARLDLWIVALAVPLMSTLGFIRGYFDAPSHYQFDPSQPGAQEILALIAAEQGHYAFPYSVITNLESVPWALVAVFFLVSMTIGGEYGWGTIRTSFLASTDRHRFLASRSIAMAVIAVAVMAALLALAIVLPAFLSVTGNVLPSSIAIGAGDVAVAIVARLVVVAFVVALGSLLAVATRNPAFPLLFALVYFIAESYLANSSFFRDADGPTWAAHLLPFQSVAGLLGDTLRAIAPGDSQLGGQVDQFGATAWPVWLSFVVVGAWSAAFYAVADRVLGRSDITE